MIAVLDLEGNGLRDTITEVHCVVVKSLDTDKIFRFTNRSNISLQSISFDLLPRCLSNITKLIGHNIISYDIPVLNKFFGVDLNEIELVDTYIVSQLLDPDRELPEGCPVSVRDPVTGRKKLVGPHSLEALGWALGERKIHHYDWTVFSPEMLARCESDVLITEKVYIDFMEQMKK
jgi:hypothetical protein